jgi:hypothetical protein
MHSAHRCCVQMLSKLRHNTPLGILGRCCHTRVHCMHYQPLPPAVLARLACVSISEHNSCCNDCCFGCRRYSPNLSKRTTHLVTPQVVGTLSDKLSAAAAAGSRFSTHIVSIGWVAASAASRGRVAEVQYAPALPGAQQVRHNPPKRRSNIAEPAAVLWVHSSICMCATVVIACCHVLHQPLHMLTCRLDLGACSMHECLMGRLSVD